MSRIRSLTILALVCAACVGHGDAEPWTPENNEVAPAAALQPRTPAPTIPAGRLVGAYHNVEIHVTQPVQSAEAVRTLVLEAGGEVIGFNADSQQGSVNAALDPASVERFSHALSRLPGTFVHENSSSNDVSQVVGQLQERLAKLERAEAEMDQIMRGTPDRDAFEAWLVQRELNTRERDSLHNQITSYLQQVRRAQFSVTLRIAPVDGAPPVAGIGHGLRFGGEH